MAQLLRNNLLCAALLLVHSVYASPESLLNSAQVDTFWTVAQAPDQNQALMAMPVSRLQQALTDMGLEHETKPRGGGPGWKDRPLVVMGTEPYGSSIPQNWPGIRFAEWRAVLPWFVIYEGLPDNPAKNTAVEINGIELWYLSSTDRVWRLLTSGVAPSWDGSYNPDAIAVSDKKAFRRIAGAQAAFAPESTVIVHGGLGQVETPWISGTDKADIAALFVSVRHRLTLKDKDGQDDRNTANFVVQAGADYYPRIGARLGDLNAKYVPGVGLGRFMKVQTSWRYSTLLVTQKGLNPSDVLKARAPNLAY